MVMEGELLWTPSPARTAASNLTKFSQWLKEHRGLDFADYQAMYEWSVADVDALWGALWEYFNPKVSAQPTAVLGKRTMPGAEWFPGAVLNYAENLMAKAVPGQTALIHFNERDAAVEMSWDELGSQVRRLATALRSLGVEPGDRVVGCLPNTPHAVISMLATTSIGAIWSGCGPDFGSRGVLDRYSQLAPKVMICVDGYQYGGKPFDRRDEMAHIANNLPTLQKVVLLPYLDRNNRAPLVEGGLLWDDLLATADPGEAAFLFEQVPAQSPLWILFSSGTTGLPKPIVHTHVGITLEQQKLVQLHMDVKVGERLFFYTTTGWMMWNFLVSSLLSGVVPVLYDGNPAWPGPDQLWKVVQDFKITLFGASPTYQQILEKQGIVPKDRFDLSHLQTVMLAGSPVTPECMAWFYNHVKADLWVQSGSGGTDICSGFCGGVPTQPVYAGEIQAPHLGVNLLAFDADGKPVVDEVGEMVITTPMPSMPMGFWNDAGHVRYTESYFSDYPGIWRQGDFFRLNARRGCFVLGRSDATLNRHGIRIGTAEIYRSLALLPEVEDSLVVNLDLPGGHFFMPLFVKVRAGSVLDKDLEDRIKAVLRTEYSPRHVPDRIFPVPAIPYTITGKKLEVPVRRILAGYAVEKAVNRSAMADATAIDWYIDYAANQTDYKM